MLPQQSALQRLKEVLPNLDLSASDLYAQDVLPLHSYFIPAQTNQYRGFGAAPLLASLSLKC